MKIKRVFGVMLSLIILMGIIKVPVEASYIEYTDVEVIKAEEKISYMVPDKTKTIKYVFTKKSQGKWIPVQPQQDGILCIGEGTSIYDSNKKLVQNIKDTEDGGIFIKNVKKTDVFFIKLPDDMKENIVVNISIKKDNVPSLKNDILYTQSGQNKNIYQMFNVKKRSIQPIYVAPVCYNGSNVVFYIQKKNNGKWVSITQKMTVSANDHVQKEFYTGLKQGQYRLVSKAAENQIYQIRIKNSALTSKYQTKQTKAQKVKLKKTVTNLYTTTEKASRWYRMSRATSRYKRYVKMSVKNNSGKMKFTIYKKGRKKALKSYTLSGNSSKTYRLKNGSGTYYVKVSKSGSRMNGEYKIQYK
ncbi:hypothetical protein [Anaerostipes sp.]|uniref:hypothetical protein n=1 Tax=Anaerostipes sp. TaxID=1872530 RepID=UPI0025BE6BC5|nr:hypothetical protein [Anaerostipes sp.]MBS7007279.1 hypothetical protein [Anaerostipes sp.]